MAYDTDQIPAQVYLFPAGRKPKGKAAYVCQYNDCIFGERVLAWGQLDVRGMGAAARTGRSADKEIPQYMEQTAGDFAMVSDDDFCQLCFSDFPCGYAGAGIYYVPQGGQAGIASCDTGHAGGTDTAGIPASGGAAAYRRDAGSKGCDTADGFSGRSVFCHAGDEKLSGKGVCV